MYNFKRLYTPDGHVRGVTILHAKTRWHISPSLLEQGVNQGWITDSGATLRVRGDNRLLVYDVVRRPGYYCCHCEREVGDGTAGGEHVRGQHAGVPSPDANNLSGYRRDNFFTCILKED